MTCRDFLSPEPHPRYYSIILYIRDDIRTPEATPSSSAERRSLWCLSTSRHCLEGRGNTLVKEGERLRESKSILASLPYEYYYFC